MVTIRSWPRLIGCAEIRAHQPVDALQAIVDVAEGSGLFAIAPDFDVWIPGELSPSRSCGTSPPELFRGLRPRFPAVRKYCEIGRCASPFRNLRRSVSTIFPRSVSPTHKHPEAEPDNASCSFKGVTLASVCMNSGYTHAEDVYKYRPHAVLPRGIQRVDIDQRVIVQESAHDAR